MTQDRESKGIKPVQLSNGAIEADVLVAGTMLSLRDLIATHPIAFYELVSKCRDKEHQFFGNTEEVLKNSGLVEQHGEIHDSIKNVVLSAAKGDGLDMTLGSPLPIPNQDPK